MEKKLYRVVCSNILSRYPQCLKRQKPRLFMNRWNGIVAIPQKYQRCFETIIAKRKGHHTLHQHGKLNIDGAFYYFPFYPSTSFGAFLYYTLYPATTGAFCYFIFHVPQNLVVSLSKSASMHAKVRAIL